MKRIIISTMLLGTLSSMALPIRYSYDAAGNRVKRELVVRSSPMMSPQKSNYYTDDLSDDFKVKLTPIGQGRILIEIVSNGSISDGLVSVYTLSGMNVYSSKIENGQLTLDLSDYSENIFVLNIEVDKKKTSWKITKQ